MTDVRSTRVAKSRKARPHRSATPGQGRRFLVPGTMFESGEGRVPRFPRITLAHSLNPDPGRTDIAAMPAREPRAPGSLFSKTMHLPTPFLVLDTDQVRSNVREIRRVLPEVGVSYALKCNADPRIVEAIRGLDVGFEVA